MLFVDYFVDISCDGLLCPKKISVRSLSSRGTLRLIRSRGWSCFLAPRSRYPWFSDLPVSTLCYRVYCPDCAKKYETRGRKNKKKVDCSSVSSDSGDGVV